jgi:dipeptidyl-peptidase-4
MRCARYVCSVVMAGVVVLTARPEAAPPARLAPPTIAQFLSAASPLEVVAATKVDRLAWIAYEQGKRNVYTAAAPAFSPVRLTKYFKDDGVDLTDVEISADGSMVVFVRGSAPNRQGWNANPAGDPNGSEQAIWAARPAAPGVSWRVAEGAAPELSPDGRFVVFARNGQIFRARLSPVRAATEIDRAERPFIKEWGTNSAPRWSPDGRKIAFVSDRGDHSFIAVYDVATRTLQYMSPSVDHDMSPAWSADSNRLAFIRRPGTPFGLQTQSGGNGLGLPAGPSAAQAARGAAGQARGAGAPQGTQGGRARGAGQTSEGIINALPQVPGLVAATFKGGYTVSFWVADVASGEAREFWHNDPADPRFANIVSIRWESDSVVFPMSVAGAGRAGRAATTAPVDEWDRYYSVNVATPNLKPVLLTSTDGLIEDASSVAFSADGRTLFYCTNAKDIERRHIWAVPTSGGTPRQVTSGDGIETRPAPLASGRSVATLSAGWNMPQSLGIWPMMEASGAPTASQRIIFPSARPGFPADVHVVPELVMTTAPDGLQIHNQLFVPKNGRSGERHPAMIFVHGGPQRQMLLGYHYRYVYHMFYAVNEWLASEGYVVMSINYRSGIGYGRSFRTAPGTEARGNSEYQDIVAGARYLQSRPDVDPKRIGIYGLSYGGLLTAQALARNSDTFAAGVDYAGVHLYGSSLDPNDLSYQSSAISQIDKWKSPVLLIQGDDDRNVNFAQTVGLVQLLRQRDVYHELIVFPDDVHDSLLHSRWLYLLGRMDTFLQKFLGENALASR